MGANGARVEIVPQKHKGRLTRQGLQDDAVYRGGSARIIGVVGFVVGKFDRRKLIENDGIAEGKAVGRIAHLEVIFARPQTRQVFGALSGIPREVKTARPAAHAQVDLPHGGVRAVQAIHRVGGDDDRLGGLQVQRITHELAADRIGDGQLVGPRRYLGEVFGGGAGIPQKRIIGRAARRLHE